MDFQVKITFRAYLNIVVVVVFQNIFRLEMY